MQTSDYASVVESSVYFHAYIRGLPRSARYIYLHFYLHGEILYKTHLILDTGNSWHRLPNSAKFRITESCGFPSTGRNMSSVGASSSSSSSCCPSVHSSSSRSPSPLSAPLSWSSSSLSPPSSWSPPPPAAASAAGAGSASFWLAASLCPWTCGQSKLSLTMV